MSELKIGPILTVHLKEGEVFVPTMQQAYEVDDECGAHWLNNAKAAEFNRRWPTVAAMAALIEKERDEYKARCEAAERLVAMLPVAVIAKYINK